MKAILIDPKARTIEEIDIANGIAAIYAALGCECVDAVRLDERHALYVDDDGLFAARCDFFAVGESNPLANRGLILSSNDDGDSVDCALPLDLVRRAVRFITPEQALELAQRRDEEAHAYAKSAEGRGFGFTHVMPSAPLVADAIAREESALVLGQCRHCFAINRHEPNCTRPK